MDAVLTSTEIEFYVETMRPHTIQEVGNSSWLEWHERLQKLNQEAIIEASAMKDEHVKEAIISFNKATVLVHEALLINVWKHKILPILLSLEPNPGNTFIAYSILYHEAISIGLLELLMFYGGGCESLGDSAADLLEYSYDNAAQLLVIQSKEYEAGESGRNEILRQKNTLDFDIGIRSLSILRYLAEYIDRVTLSIASRMYTVHDVPVLLIELLLKKPWYSKGKVYNRGQWIDHESEAITQPEAQIWLALRQLLLDPACINHYPITDSRRSQLMKLMPLMTPILLDQLAPMTELNYFLCKLSVSDLPAASHKHILLEAVLEIKATIMKQGEKKWKKIAREQVGFIFSTDHEHLVRVAQRLSSAYNTDLLEKIDIKNKNKCRVCGIEAVQRCSKCKKSWYCSRKCQVDDWQTHKEDCTL